MFGMTVSEAAAICGGSVHSPSGSFEDAELGRIVIDSRAVRAGDLFAAYRGEKVDGHNYIPAAFASGAACALAERLPEELTGTVILTDDVQTAVEQIAGAFRQRLNIPVVGIVGSVGKTTAKEMVWSVLTERLSTLKTEANLNNTIGVPMTVSGIAPEHEAAVIELGINHFGEMEHLGRVARPDVLLYTLIGHAHLEFLGDLDGVLRAKTELLPYLPEGGTVVINGDDLYQRRIVCPQRIVSYGLGDDCDVRASDIVRREDGISCTIAYLNRTVRAEIPAIGDHMINAALEGAAVGFLLGLSDDEIARGISHYRTVGRRLSITDTGSLRLLDDCYNANPDSLKSSLRTLCSMPGRKVCVLGDMRELGEDSPAMHREVGRYAAQAGCDMLICSGIYAGDYAEGFGGGMLFESKAELIAALPDVLKRGDAVLVKASLGSAFAEVSDAIKNLEL